MAARIAARYVSRRVSSGGKVLSEEEKAAENVYIKLSPQPDVNDVKDEEEPSISSSAKEDRKEPVRPSPQRRALACSWASAAFPNPGIKDPMIGIHQNSKMEQDKLEKLARKGVGKPGEQPPTPETAAAQVKPSGSSGSSTAGVSTDKNRNYAVLAGTVAAVSALGWYLLSPKKTEEPVD